MITVTIIIVVVVVVVVITILTIIDVMIIIPRIIVITMTTTIIGVILIMILIVLATGRTITTILRHMASTICSVDFLACGGPFRGRATTLDTSSNKHFLYPNEIEHGVKKMETNREEISNNK